MANRKLKVLNSFNVREGYSLGGFVGTDFISMRQVLELTETQVTGLPDPETNTSECFDLVPVTEQEWRELLKFIPQTEEAPPVR